MTEQLCAQYTVLSQQLLGPAPAILVPKAILGFLNKNQGAHPQICVSEHFAHLWTVSTHLQPPHTQRLKLSPRNFIQTLNQSKLFLLHCVIQLFLS